MRTIGCVMVAAGFLWIVTVQLLIKPTGKVVSSRHYTSVNPTNQYTGQELRRQVDLAINELGAEIPAILPPGIVMLVGAILIDAASRKSRNSN